MPVRRSPSSWTSESLLHLYTEYSVAIWSLPPYMRLQTPCNLLGVCGFGTCHMFDWHLLPVDCFELPISVSQAPLCRLNKQRKEIITMLQTLTMDGDNGYGSAVDKTDELRRNMQQEARITSRSVLLYSCILAFEQPQRPCYLGWNAPLGHSTGRTFAPCHR